MSIKSMHRLTAHATPPRGTRSSGSETVHHAADQQAFQGPLMACAKSPTRLLTTLIGDGRVVVLLERPTVTCVYASRSSNSLARSGS